MIQLDQTNDTKEFRLIRIALLLLFGFAATPALAHSGDTGGFIPGILHPVLGLDHFVAMIGVGLLGAVLGGTYVWRLPMIFPFVMAVGAATAIRGFAVEWAELFIGLSAIAIGIYLSASTTKWRIIIAPVIAFFAFFHGYAHGTELPTSGSPVNYCIGFIFGTGLIHSVGIAIAWALEKLENPVPVFRLTGLGIAVIGMIFVGGML